LHPAVTLGLIAHATFQVAARGYIVMPPDDPQSWEDAVNLEDEADIRLKLRHARTALKEIRRAAQRDGLYGPELEALETSLDALALALEKALTHKRNGG
jgi:hypothetical protein